MKLSIVTTLYLSAPYIEAFYQRIKDSAAQITDDYEIIFVDDGSPDNVTEFVKQYAQEDSRVVLIELSRNFGHHKAIMTGLQHASGDFVFLMDCDLEEDPELLLTYWQTMQEANAQQHTIDLVCGVQTERKGRWFEKLSGKLFFKILNSLSDIQILPNPLSARLMTRRFANDITKFKEQELTYIGVEAMTGYRRKVITMPKNNKGKSTYTLSKKIQVAMRYVTALSAKPLVYIFYLGCFFTLISMLMFCFLIIRKAFFGVNLLGWTSLMASVWFFGGLLIFCIGVVGIYISVIYNEVKDRPYTLIREKHNIN